MCLSRLPSPSMCSLNGDSGGDFFDADGSYNDMTAFAKKNAASAGREWEGHERRKYQDVTSLFSKYLSLLYQERNHINNDYWLLCFKVAQQLGLPWDPKCLLHWENQKGEEGTCSRQVWSFSLPSCLVYLSFLIRLTPISIPTTLFFTTSPHFPLLAGSLHFIYIELSLPQTMCILLIEMMQHRIQRPQTEVWLVQYFYTFASFNGYCYLSVSSYSVRRHSVVVKP